MLPNRPLSYNKRRTRKKTEDVVREFRFGFPHLRIHHPTNAYGLWDHSIYGRYPQCICSTEKRNEDGISMVVGGSVGSGGCGDRRLCQDV